MSQNYVLEDTEQTKRMKKLCFSSAYSCGGEIYKLLSYETLHELVKKISKGEIKLKSDLLYGKCIITKEEKFIENLDKYIGYIKDNYHISHYELPLLIELSLKNKYSDILFSLEDYHEGENYHKFIDGFRKMFLFNIVNNAHFYVERTTIISSIRYFISDISKYNFNNKEDIIEIEKIMKRILNNKKDNIYDAYVPHTEVKSRDYDFYTLKLEMVLNSYYEENTGEVFDLKKDDKFIKLYNEDILLFNVCSKPSKLDRDGQVVIEFGVKNKNFNAKKENIRFRKDEWATLCKRLKKVKIDEVYHQEYDFVDSSLRFEFFNDEGIQYLDIRFEYSNNGDAYWISFTQEDTEELYKLIKEQI